MATHRLPPDHSVTADAAPESSLAGQMLVAMPGIGDPRFERSVIYIFAHQDSGAMGLVVNHSTRDIDFAELLSQLELELPEGAPTPPVRIGGPVETERGFVLHSPDYHRDEATLKVDDEISMTATVDVLHAIAAGEGPTEAFFALGYAGWGPGQLESEILSNGWLHCQADKDLVFGDDDDDKWGLALEKIGVDPSKLSAASGSA
ncbi:MAG: YqgE/AlgH family protein [Pseudomonadota bacterium]